MTEHNEPNRTPDEWDAERAKLGARLDRFKADRRSADFEQAPTGSMQGMAQGLKIASEFIAGVLVGAAIGYAVDWVFGISPFGLIAFLLFGFAAGVLNVIRSASGKADQPPNGHS